MIACKPAALVAPVVALLALATSAQDAMRPPDSAPDRVCRTSQFVGAGVTGTEGEKIGELTDLVIDDDHATVAVGVISLGEEKLVAIPFSKLQRTGTDETVGFVLAAPEAARATGFEAKSWPTFDRVYVAKLYALFKAKPYWKVAAPRDPTVATGEPAADPARESTAPPNGPDRCCAFRVTQALGQPVQDAHAKKIGELQDIVFDGLSGRVAYAVLATAPVGGAGERLIALPWAALQPVSVDGKPRVLDLPPQKFEKAPGFDRKTWPDMNDRRWGADVHRYWELQPYWGARSGDGP